MSVSTIVSMMLILAAADIPNALEYTSGEDMKYCWKHPRYVIEKATNANDANKWVLFFQGGSGCISAKGCHSWFGKLLPELNDPVFVTDFDSFKTISSDAKVNNFAGWNRVKFIYCSGDSWQGTNMTDIFNGTHHKTEPKHLYQNGFHNAVAIVNALVEKHNLGNASDIVVSGESAGAKGMLWGFPWIYEKFHESTPRISGVPIAGYYMLDEHFDEIISPKYQDKTGDIWGASENLLVHWNFWNVAGSLKYTGMDAMKECAQRMGTNEQHWCMLAFANKCFQPAPIFFIQSNVDKMQLENSNVGIDYAKICDAASNEKSYLGNFQQKLNAELKYMAWNGDKALEEKTNGWTDQQLSCIDHFGTKVSPQKSGPQSHGSFVVSCWTHTKGFQDDSMKIEKQSWNSALQQWYAGHDVQLIDSAVWPKMTHGCSPDYTTTPKDCPTPTPTPSPFLL